MDTNPEVQKLTEELMAKLKIEAKVSVTTDETEAFRVQIETSETGLLIGYHGRTMESLQIILGLLVAKLTGKWTPVYVNIGDYREKREEALMLMAQRAADRAIAMNRPVELTRLSPSERRIVHLTLSGDERVITESTGEGESRVLLVKPK